MPVSSPKPVSIDVCLFKKKKGEKQCFTQCYFKKKICVNVHLCKCAKLSDVYLYIYLYTYIHIYGYVFLWFDLSFSLPDVMSKGWERNHGHVHRSTHLSKLPF